MSAWKRLADRVRSALDPSNVARPGQTAEQLGGVPGRAKVIETHSFLSGVEFAVFGKMVVTVEAPDGRRYKTDCWLSEDGHRLLHSARTVPVRIDPQDGLMLGIDVELYETEAAEHLKKLEAERGQAALKVSPSGEPEP